MHRDMDLIRQILFEVEKCSNGYAPQEIKVDGYKPEQISYHVALLGQAGLMQVQDVTSMGSSGPEAIPLNLTWEGHDFLDAARNDTMWSQAKQKAKAVGGTLSLAVLKQVLDSLLKTHLGL